MVTPMRVGHGHDTHRFGEERPLLIGGVEIPHPIGLVGHSDADVLFHAVTDALLGATGQGDIGEWFPDTDPAHKDQDSRELLADVVASVRKLGAEIVNIDCTIHAQRPKLSPHKPAIRESVARTLGIPADRVNIKAKTGEKVGPIGRSEAIVADAVVLVSMEGTGS
ncbi:2-C-methyl-D-erythritol 2,4-cyclodiphosphate synthase [Planctomycetes bacterium Pan216]|uniref:2-C-methyl-D-erythritol 2,4-cyclodiphosphate synthase n=1 Tax=Kolteria novifilia TaxID=2527975 RepID=A0A518B539_9BACT|nr:2-C-methyl-D-erythritol 2,4-cyclodiphosphate synthase [Planctomycetes bacterium Pan216]